MKPGVNAVVASHASTPNLLAPLLKGFLQVTFAYWPVWLAVGVVGLGKLLLRLHQLRRLSRSGIADVDRVDGRAFETFLGTLFKRLGYSVDITKHRGDYGADLIIVKNAKRTAVQAKRWSKPVGVKAVQEAVAAKGYYGCDNAMVVANRTFTRQAHQLARANSVQLWDRDALVSRILTTRDNGDRTTSGTGRRQERVSGCTAFPPPAAGRDGIRQRPCQPRGCQSDSIGASGEDHHGRLLPPARRGPRYRSLRRIA
jgi:restriction system protein